MNFIADSILVGEVFRDKTSKKYTLLEIAPNHWDDGATGYRLIAGYEKSLPFWVRSEELRSIYRTGNRPFPE